MFTVNSPFRLVDNVIVLSSATYMDTLQTAAAAAPAAGTPLIVPTLSTTWLRVRLLLVAMVGLRYGRIEFSRR